MSLILKRISIELHPQTYDCLSRLAGGHHPTPEDVATYLVLRGLADLVKIGVAEARHNENVISLPPEPKPLPLQPKKRTPLKADSAGLIWCSQCERRVRPDYALQCTSPWCKAIAA